MWSLPLGRRRRAPCRRLGILRCRCPVQVEHCRALWPLLYTDWEPFNGSEPEDLDPVLLDEEGRVELTLAPYSGLCFAVEED